MNSVALTLTDDDGLQNVYSRLLDEAIAVLAERYQLGCAYLSGSLAFGLGSRTSDLDVVGIVAGEVPDHTFDLADSGVTCDVQVHSRQSVAAKLRHFQRPVVAEDYQHVLDGGWSWLKFLSRLAGGLPLAGQEDFSALKAEVEPRRLGRHVASHHGLSAITFMGDTYGAVVARDYLTAWDTSAYALRHSAQMVLAAAGDYYIGEKFLRRRLVNTEATRPLVGLFVEALDPAGGFPGSDEETMRVIERRSRLAGICSDAVLMHDLGAAESNVADLVERGLTRGAMSRDPYTATVLLDDAVLLGGREGNFVSRPVGLCYCLSYRASSVSDVAQEFSKITSVKECAPFVAKSIDMLVSRDYLLPQPI